MDDGTIFIAGGHQAGVGDLNTAYLFNRVMGWKKLPNMLRKRSHMMCGLVTNSKGDQKIVVAGGQSSPGFNWDNNGDYRIVESFDLATMEWTREDDFPFIPLGITTNVPHGRSFLSVGGYANRVTYDHIYRYDPDTNDWDMLPITLKKPLHEPAAFILDENTISC